jgi:hypothetical protein
MENFCKGCDHYDLCIYQEDTNRIYKNLGIDTDQYPPNVAVKLVCKHRKVTHTPKIQLEEDTFF